MPTKQTKPCRSAVRFAAQVIEDVEQNAHREDLVFEDVIAQSLHDAGLGKCEEKLRRAIRYLLHISGEAATARMLIRQALAALTGEQTSYTTGD